MRYVVDAGTVRELARENAVLSGDLSLVAPSLIKSQLLDQLFRESNTGQIDRDGAKAVFDYFRSLRFRLLSDRVSQMRAWDIATRLGWDSTEDAEYVGITLLQADALVTSSDRVAADAASMVRIAPVTELVAGTRS